MSTEEYRWHRIRTPVALYVDGERVGSASIVADCIYNACMADARVEDVEMSDGVVLPDGVKIEAHFTNPREGIAFIAAQNPLKIGKDC